MTAKNSAKPDSAPKPTPKTVLPPPWAFLVAKHPRFLDLFNIVFPGYVAPDEPGYTMKHGIDAMKGLTPIVCLALAARYNRSSATMATYTALHGVYGLLWVIKSYMFPDKKWEKRVPWSQLGLCITILGGFWLIPYRIAKYNVEHSPARLGTMIAANIIVRSFKIGRVSAFCVGYAKGCVARASPGKANYQQIL